MYRLLAAGSFGNTVPQYFSVEAWRASADYRLYPQWGVRSATVSGHPACKLWVPTTDVAGYAAQHFPGTANISPMVDAVAEVTAWLEVMQSQSGLVVEGVVSPRVSEGWNWRNSMRDPTRRKRWEGTAAKCVLVHNLNDNSLADLNVLLDQYPEHVVELSAINRCLGTVPHRNAIIWEVRLY